MGCEKVRDQFSSLLEGDLNPKAEEEIRAHLSTCGECQKEFQGFEKTFCWLHAAEEVEVPEGFLAGVYKKIGERKGENFLSKKVKWKWISAMLPFKLPAQAAAMVAIVFLVIYLTKMMPVEKSFREIDRQAKPPTSETTGVEKEQVFKEKDESRTALKPPVETLRPQRLEQIEVPHSEAKKMERELPQKEAASPELQSSASVEERVRKTAVLRAKASPPLGAPQEIALRTSDREKALSQLTQLVERLKGEIVTIEENVLLASLPTASIPEFEKELEGIGYIAKADGKSAPETFQKDLSAASELKRGEVEEKGKGLTIPRREEEERIRVRVILLRE